MTWDKGLLAHARTGDSETDQLLELASEWHVKAVSFARLHVRSLMDDALNKCYRALVLAAMQMKTESPDPVNSDEFWEEFGAAGYPGSEPGTPNDPARVPRKPFPPSRGSEVSMPHPSTVEEND